MKKDLLDFFSLERSIFGICPNGGHFFRLSDCKVYQKKKPEKDWFELMREKETNLGDYEGKTEERRNILRQRATERGAALGRKRANKLDPVFSRLKLNSADAKVIFHPIDYIVFDGMNGNGCRTKRVVLLDRIAKDSAHGKVQKSIEAAVSRGRYEWKTMTIEDSGKIVAKN